MNESYRGPRLTTAKLSQIICYILSHNPYTVIQVSLIQLYAQYFSNRQPFLMGNWKLYLSMFSSKPDSIFKTSTLTLLNMRAAGLQLPQSVSLCYCVTVTFKPLKRVFWYSFVVNFSFYSNSLRIFQVFGFFIHREGMWEKQSLLHVLNIQQGV